MLRDIQREIDDAYKQDRHIAWIRVTTDALRGSITTTPISPERSRQIRLVAHETGGVDTDWELLIRPYLEILIHPHDWYSMLANEKPVDLVWAGFTQPNVRELFGIPVRRD